MNLSNFPVWQWALLLAGFVAFLILAFVMAFLIARHRVKDSIHDIWEVLAGAVLVALLTTIVFQLFR